MLKNIRSGAVGVVILLLVTAAIKATTPDAAHAAKDFLIHEPDEIEFTGSGQKDDAVSKAIAHYAMAIIYEMDGKLEDAVGEFRQAIQLDADAVVIYVRLAAALLVLNRTDEAISVLAQGKQVNPSAPEPPFLLALAYTKQERFAEAAEEYKAILEQNPRNLRAMSSLADILIVQEKLEDAAKVYEQLLTTGEGSDRPLIHFNLGILYSKLNDNTKAIEHFKRTVELDDKYLQGYTALGVLYETEEQYEQAVENLEEAVKIEPLSRNLGRHLADMYHKAGRKKDAVHQYGLLIDLYPDDPNVYIGLASLYTQDDEMDKALEVLDRGLASPAQDKAKLTRFKGFIYSSSRKYEQAIELYLGILESAPSDIQALFYLASAYERSGQRELAIKKFRQCLALDPDNAEVNNYLGYMYAENGEMLDEALAMIKKALGVDPNNGAYIDSLGWAYFQKGMLDEALRELERAAALIDDDPTVRDHLGDVYYKAGETDKAIAEWEKALQMEPEQEGLKTSILNKIKEAEKRE